MANGKVATGFSKPYVAKYTESSGAISFSGGMPLARGVDVDISVSSSDDNTFYADNVLAESEGGKFKDGTLSLTVDGLLAAAERFIYGLPAAVDDWTDYGDDMEVPYIGTGFIVRYQSDGVVTYVPIILPKTKFNQLGTTAATQEETISWQTQALEASIHRADNANHSWKWVGKDYDTEAAAEAALKAKLGIAA